MSIDLFRPFMAPEAKEAVARVLTPDDRGRLYVGQGPLVDRFEAALREAFVSDEPILTVNSCTSALDLALHLCGVLPGDYVITTPMTCSATNSPIVTRGATPLWADVDPLTGLIDPESVAAVLKRWRAMPSWERTGQVGAVIAVDWGGRACDYRALRAAAPGIPIVEDAAHAALATYDGRPIAYMGGDYVCWSFQAIKHLTTGDGGALRVPAAQYERAKLLRWYGLDRTQGESFRCSQDIPEVGYKYHLNDIAAAIGLANLPHLAEVVWKHRQHARAYHAALAGIPGLTLPPPDAGSSWWLYTLLCDDGAARDDLIAFLGTRGIAASPVHARNDRHTGFGGPSLPGVLPGVDAFAAREVAIPVGWWLTPADRAAVAGAIQEWAAVRAPAPVAQQQRAAELVGAA